MTKKLIRANVSDMKTGQVFAFSRQSLDAEEVWQKKGTRTISRIKKSTGEVIATYYFTKEDFGYYVEESN